MVNSYGCSSVTGNDCYSRCTVVMYNNIIMPKTAARDIFTERKLMICALFEFHSRVFYNLCLLFNNNNDDIIISFNLQNTQIQCHHFTYDCH